MNPVLCLVAAFCLAAGSVFFPSCTPMSNRAFTESHPEYRGVNRVAIFLQRWPVYLKLKGYGPRQIDFIKKRTPFLGVWEPADLVPARAVDVEDFDDQVMEKLLVEVFRDKGYQPFLSEIIAPRPQTAAEIMTKYQAVDPQVDGFLFCFYSPTLYFSSPRRTPPEHKNRPFNLLEVIQILQPHENAVLWAGPRAGRAPENSISQAFIFISMTMFKAHDHRILWTVTDAQSGGRMRRYVPECYPGPTDESYWADATVIFRLMRDNLRCRLRRLIPDSF